MTSSNLVLYPAGVFLAEFEALLGDARRQEKINPANQGEATYALKISERYAYALRSGEGKIPEKRIPEITKFAAEFAREFLKEKNAPNIPENDELVIIRMGYFVRNSTLY